MMSYPRGRYTATHQIPRRPWPIAVLRAVSWPVRAPLLLLLLAVLWAGACVRYPSRRGVVAAVVVLVAVAVVWAGRRP